MFLVKWKGLPIIVIMKNMKALVATTCQLIVLLLAAAATSVIVVVTIAYPDPSMHAF
jgi:hypothetical protein